MVKLSPLPAWKPCADVWACPRAHVFHPSQPPKWDLFWKRVLRSHFGAQRRQNNAINPCSLFCAPRGKLNPGMWPPNNSETLPRKARHKGRRTFCLLRQPAPLRHRFSRRGVSFQKQIMKCDARKTGNASCTAQHVREALERRVCRCFKITCFSPGRAWSANN